ncbi:hypothetical protein E3P84_00254 [Wallemia ichthyophaga]|nr:hypothetical protein E3P84_00254 [Wallemia ichthyophaga]TIB44304.1 hypothetical protein E3P83_00254 [Wallemia ichthyophaga]
MDDTQTPRSDIFVLSKLYNNSHRKEDVEKALDVSLSELGLEYLDAYIIHWPAAFKPSADNRANIPQDDHGVIINDRVPYRETWEAMEHLLSTGKVRSIGVSNLTVDQLSDMLSYARVKPSILQVEIHPRLPQHRLVEFAKSQGIVVEGYSPFGNANALYDQQNQLLQDATIGLIAKKHSVSAPTVITNWMIANAQQINLDDEDYRNLNAQALTFSRRYCDLSELCGVVFFADEKSPEQIKHQSKESVRTPVIGEFQHIFNVINNKLHHYQRTTSRPSNIVLSFARTPLTLTIRMPIQTERIAFANAPATAADTNSAGIPKLGYGCWNLPNEKAADLVYAALEAGYRHIDSAAIYQNEREVGQGITRWLKATGTPRSEIFVTSKLWLNSKKPENVTRGLNKTLEDLQLEYLDLYLIHWPGALATGPNYDGSAQIPQDDKGFPLKDHNVEEKDTWAALETQVPQKCKNIGISNYTKSEIADLLKTAKIRPSSLQVELHVYNQQPELVKYAQSQGIQVTAYSPFGGLNHIYGSNAEVVEDPAVKALAQKYQTSNHGIALSFLLAKNISPIPKTVSRIKENFESVVALSAEDVQTLEGANKNKRYNDGSEMLGYIYFKDEKDTGTILSQIGKAGLSRAQAKVEHLVGK